MLSHHTRRENMWTLIVQSKVYIIEQIKPLSCMYCHTTLSFPLAEILPLSVLTKHAIPGIRAVCVSYLEVGHVTSVHTQPHLAGK